LAGNSRAARVAGTVETMSHRQWNYTIQYHPIVLRTVPVGCQRALDVGCGTGLVTRGLASRSESVIGIDVDPEVLSLARSFPELESSIQYLEGDVMTYPFLPATFDFITAVAALHHLPLRPALARFRDLLTTRRRLRWPTRTRASSGRCWLGARNIGRRQSWWLHQRQIESF
jgi:SAM-dependent methyltransferase